MKVEIKGFRPREKSQYSGNDYATTLKMELDQIRRENPKPQVETYEEDGLKAVLHSTDEEGKLFHVTSEAGDDYFARYLDKPFYCPTYYKDDNIEWKKDYDEYGDEIYYEDSNGTVIKKQFNPETNQYEVIPDEPAIGESWGTDKERLDYILDRIRDNLTDVDRILKCYLETDGETVAQVSEAFAVTESIEQLIQETDDYYKNPETETCITEEEV